ncbi:tyrosine-type recombinase/integrase [Peijinzhouia sedimentorum]
MQTSTKSTTLADFKRELEFRHYSPRTVKTYGHLMTRLVNEIRLPLENITLSAFKDYLHRVVIGKGHSASSINQYISAFKIVQVDVLGNDWEDFKVKRPKRLKKLPVVLSFEEIERLINVNKNLKHKAIIMLAYSSGLRRNELLNLLPQDIDSERMQVRVQQGKGRKDRYTLLSEKTLKILRLYYQDERPKKYLFEPHYRRGQPLSETTLANIVKNKLKIAGIHKAVSFHTLRHTFATHLLEQGVNLRLIQQFMGHTSLKTTAMYLHLSKPNPSSVLSPLDLMDV